MRIQICSDLHLWDNEIQKEGFIEILEPSAPVLALLGDIGDPESKILPIFIDWCCKHWEQVLYVPGNHEFWRLIPGTKKNIDLTLDMLRQYETKYTNFKLCWQTKFVSEDGILILATPLWSRPSEGVTPNDGEQTWFDRDRTFDRMTLTSLHQKDLNWINRECKLAENHAIICLTHYAPTLMLIDRDRIQDPEVTLFASDIETALRPPIVAWACGHTHQSVMWTKSWENASGIDGEVLLVSNPRGSKGSNRFYRKEFVLKIDPSQFKRPQIGEYPFGRIDKSLE